MRAEIHLYSDMVISRAVSHMAKGQLVALPTETVYGLAGDATRPEAVLEIFAAKGRPSFNPLILHVSGLAMAEDYATLSGAARKLAAAFWPGPLTMVLPAKENTKIAPQVAAGLNTFALRCPQSRTAQAILNLLAHPFAAPSANPSGGLSPTTAAHVAEGLGAKIDLIIDDGPCEVGIESTIIKVIENEITLLRPGSVTIRQIEDVSGLTVQQITDETLLAAPGMMASHYAPAATLRLNAMTAKPDEAFLGFGGIEMSERCLNLSPAGDLNEAMANLFSYLHELDQIADKIAVAPIPQSGAGLALNDRLRRAAAPRP